MKGSLPFLITGVLLATCTFASEPSRIFSEDYIVGAYGRFFELTSEGNSAPCPMVIDHFKRGSPSPTGNSWIVPHNKIVQNGQRCDDGGSLVLSPYNQSSEAPSSLTANKIAEQTFELMRDDSTGFWMGPDSRTCGKWQFPDPSFIFFVREFDRKTTSFFNLDLAPGKKYMFVVAPSFTCIYEDIPRHDQGNEGVASSSNNPDDEGVRGTSEPESSDNSPAGDDDSDDDTGATNGDIAAAEGSNTDDSLGVDVSDGQGGQNETQSGGLSIVDIASGAEPQPGDVGTGNGNVSITDIASQTPNASDDPASANPDTAGDDFEGSDDGPDTAEGDGDNEETISEINGEDGSQNESSFDVDSDSGESLCFPGDSEVELSSGSRIPMNELAVGDKVRVAPGKLSVVFMFTHKVETEQHSFVQLTTVSGRQIRLTAGHLLYVNGALRRAGHARVGDHLVTADGKMTKIMKVSSVQARGLYNPQTLQGDIVVDGIIASTYTTTIRPEAAHSFLAPLRAMWRTIRKNVMGSVLDSHSLPKDLLSLLPAKFTAQVKTEL